MNADVQNLDALPTKGGFRLRGLEMTRLETFTDAAFAFATTMLVISLSGIPGSVADLKMALKDIPAFLASFASIASFWVAHRQWSRRYGLEDGWSTLLSLTLIFVMLVYVYPLKMVFSAFSAWLTGGWLPSGFAFAARDLPDLFVIYGLGFFALNSAVSSLYLRALKLSDKLRLNTVERLLTRHEIISFAILGSTGLVSAILAAALPFRLGVWSGFAYMTLAITMPLLAIRTTRKMEGLRTAD